MDFLKKLLPSANFYSSLAVVAITVFALVSLKRYTKGHLKRKMSDGKALIHTQFVANILKYVIIGFCIITVLQINGVNVSSLVAGLGVAGIIVGFALQDILKDLIMGTNLVWDNFFDVGDVVRYKNIEGKVIYFNIKVTKIHDIYTGNILTVCNRNISEIEKVSDELYITLPAPYGADVNTVKTAICEICQSALGIENVKTCDFLGTDGFADNCVNYKIKATCPPEFKLKVRRQILSLTQSVFDKYGICIPYPQIDVHMN